MEPLARMAEAVAEAAKGIVGHGMPKALAVQALALPEEPGNRTGETEEAARGI